MYGCQKQRGRWLYAENDTPLRKHAYSNILKILQPKRGIFQIKHSDIFHIFAQNIDRRGGSNKYPQSMFLSKIRKIMYTPVNPNFTV